MNKPKLYDGQTYELIKKYKDEGKYITIPIKYDKSESERNHQIRDIFNKYEYSRLDEEVESVIFDLNEHCQYNRFGFAEPSKYCTDDYALVFENGIILHITAHDEYYGHGEFEIGIGLDGVCVPDDIDSKEVESVAKWLNERFN